MFTVGVRWTIRLIGLLSITILARLLTPDDFGLINLAVSIVVLAEVTTYVGVRNALIRERNVDDIDYNTAWTVNFIVNITIGLITAILIAPIAADYFNRPEVTTIMRVLALRFGFNAVQNIAIVDFDRNLTFKKDFLLRSTARIFTFVLVIGTAFLFRTHWALVVGFVSRSAGLTIFSYLLHPYRPRFCLERWRKFTNYSIWMLVDAVAQGIHDQIERIALGRTADNFLLGIYTTSSQVSKIFTFEIATGISRVTFPSFASMQNQQRRIKQGIVSAFGAYALVIAPLALGMSATSDNFIPILLGEQWRATTPLFKVIAISVGLQALANPFRPILLAAGLQRFMALTRISLAAVLIAIVLVTVRLTDPLGLATTVLAAQSIFFSVYLGIVATRFRVNLLRLLAAIGRPCLAGGVMYAVVVFLPVPGDWSSFVDLVCRIGAGAVVYAIVLLSVWGISGGPDGAERKVLSMVRSRLK